MCGVLTHSAACFWLEVQESLYNSWKKKKNQKKGRGDEYQQFKKKKHNIQKYGQYVAPTQIQTLWLQQVITSLFLQVNHHTVKHLIASPETLHGLTCMFAHADTHRRARTPIDSYTISLGPTAIRERRKGSENMWGRGGNEDEEIRARKDQES